MGQHKRMEVKCGVLLHVQEDVEWGRVLELLLLEFRLDPEFKG